MPEPQIAKWAASLRQAAADIRTPHRPETVSPSMPDLAAKRVCTKYGSVMFGSQRLRVFNFDTTLNKYRYYRSREDTKDVESKSMFLARGEYEVQTKVRP